MKKYKLLKDLPWCKAAMIFELIMPMSYYMAEDGSGQAIAKEYVEKNTEWFQEVKKCEHEPDKTIMLTSYPEQYRCKKCSKSFKCDSPEWIKQCEHEYYSTTQDMYGIHYAKQSSCIKCGASENKPKRMAPALIKTKYFNYITMALFNEKPSIMQIKDSGSIPEWQVEHIEYIKWPASENLWVEIND